MVLEFLSKARWRTVPSPAGLPPTTSPWQLDLSHLASWVIAESLPADQTFHLFVAEPLASRIGLVGVAQHFKDLAMKAGRVIVATDRQLALHIME